MRRIAVLIYPHFSLQEVTILTSSLKLCFDQDLDFLGSELVPYKSEEGFLVLPSKLFSEVDPNQYECIILPGIAYPLPALYDNQIIEFLRSINRSNTLIAAISSSPLLLAKAGVLTDTKFTAGIWMQMADVFSFINKDNFIHQPLVVDNNCITAIGFAFREFAECVLEHLGYNIEKPLMPPVTREYSESELTYYFEESAYQEFLEQLKEFE